MSCNWPVDRTCLPIAEGEVERAQQRAQEDLAARVLWALSGRQFGVCPIVIRPCPSGYTGYIPGLRTLDMVGGGVLIAYRSGGNWVNTTCGCGPTCTPSGPRVVHLDMGVGLPVQAVEEVRIGGEVLDPSGYVLEGDRLYRKGGNWPSQDLGRPLGEDGTWSVRFTRGYPPPAGTGRLVALLAAEFLAACNGGECALPRRVKTVSRQGLTYQMVDPTDIYREGRTGLSEVDLWIAAVNPNRIAEPPSVR